MTKKKNFARTLSQTHGQIAKEYDRKKNMLPVGRMYAGTKAMVWWRCGKNHSYQESPYNRTHNMASCPFCHASQGERDIMQLLSGKALYKKEFIFDDLKCVNALRCDFAILDDEGAPIGIIEVNGEQHYKPVQFGKQTEKEAEENFKKTVQRDRIKYDYFEKHQIPFLVIRFDMTKEYVEKRVRDFLSELDAEHYYRKKYPKKERPAKTELQAEPSPNLKIQVITDAEHSAFHADLEIEVGRYKVRATNHVDPDLLVRLLKQLDS